MTGKTAQDENFPVGSWLLAPALRPHVAVFYRFARAADDIADDPRLPAQAKLARLDAFADMLNGAGCGGGAHPARAMRASLAVTGVSARHCGDLLAAFRQDAVRSRYESWQDLMQYCRLSAAPVGRYLLDLHGEGQAPAAAADVLCAALQVLNHLQDCGDDYRRLDRVYLPLAWLRQAGCDAGELGEGRAGPSLRAVLDRCLDNVDRLLAVAGPLPRQLRSRRLAAEADAILRLGLTLAGRLRMQDPLADRVSLGRADFAGAVLLGLWRQAGPWRR